MKLGEFFVQLGVSADTLKVKEFAKAIGEIPVQTAAAILGVVGLSLKLEELIREAFGTAEALHSFEVMTGLSGQQLQRWQIIAKQADVQAETMTSSIEGLNRQLAQIRLGQGNIRPFQLLGIDTRGQNAFQVLEQVRKKIRNVDRGTAVNILSEMGINPEMLKVLTLSDEKLAQFGRTARGMSAAQVEAFNRARVGAVQFGLVIRDLVYNLMGNFVMAFEKGSEMLHKFKGVAIGLGIVLAGLAIYFAPITVAVTALILLIEDLAGYFMGQKSLTGVAIEGLKKLGDISFDKTANSLMKLDKAIKSSPTMSKLTDFALKTGIVKRVDNTSKYDVETMPDGRVVLNQKVDIHVNGADSPEATAKAVKREQDRTLSDAALQFNTAGN